MHADLHEWTSPATGRVMQLVELGEHGPPLVYFPSSSGDHAEFERYGFAGAAAPWVESGRLRVYSADGDGPRCFWDDSLAPAERVAAYVRFERYAADELLPWVLSHAGSTTVGVLGSSYGAFVAANLWLKHPERVRIGCGLGGVYGLWHRLEGYHDDAVYFHTPLEYLPRLDDPAMLAALRRTAGFTVLAAADDVWLGSSRDFVAVLRAKRLPHRAAVTPSPADHHERWWKGQLVEFLQQAY